MSRYGYSQMEVGEHLGFHYSTISDDKLIFASDCPHWDGMFPYVVATIRERKDISDEPKRKFLGENAKRLYGWE